MHMLTDVHTDTNVFATISEAKMHDKKFLLHLNPSKGSMLVLNKAYNYYKQFADWIEESINFICRLKDNAKIQSREVLFEKALSNREFEVYKMEHIHLDYMREKKTEKLCLRLVHLSTQNDDDEKATEVINSFNNLTDELQPMKIEFTYDFRANHNRLIQTNTIWMITLGRDLDIYEVQSFLFRKSQPK